MATGMVLIIVSRNIDLSVGSVLGFTAMTMAMIQTEWLPNLLGVGLGWPLIWVIALAGGLLLGAAIGGFQGFIIAYIGVPSFIVTLGGLLVWRGLAFEEAQGRTISPARSRRSSCSAADRSARSVSSPAGSSGSWPASGSSTRSSPADGVAAATASRSARCGPRRRSSSSAAAPSSAPSGSPTATSGRAALAQQYGKPPDTPVGIADPVLLGIGVAIVMTILATRRRFGRYVFAIGGNPDAAELGGINTRRTIMCTFVIMGILAAISAAVQSARLNAAVVGLGTQSELYVIAAAVIGGTSFAGGIGTIPGAVLGAVVMQSLQSGMVLLKVDSPIQDIVVGIVLVAAVGTDAALRRRSS